jgi:hypothetical protein
MTASDYSCSSLPHFDSSFPEVSSRVLNNKSITPDIGGRILSGGARLYRFTEADYGKAEAAAKRRDNIFAATLRGALGRRCHHSVSRGRRRRQDRNA